MKHIKKLDQGKQGITGLVTSEEDGKKYVYKISQCMNYLTDHEYIILKGLKELNPTCPHFCDSVKHVKLPIHPQFRNVNQDPFAACDKPLELDVLLMEYIPDSIPLYNLIKQKSVPMYQIMACIRQIILAIMIGQKYKKFVHYDLHSMNVLMKDCDIDDVYVYMLDEENIICVPTHGFNPVIIDYGFSTSIDLQKNPLYISLAFTDSGYMAPAFDPFADMKIFLVSVAEDLKESRPKASHTPKFRNIIKNIFKDLDIDWKSGWDKSRDPPLIDNLFNTIYEVCDECIEESKLLCDYASICMDILQSMIILPFKSGTTDVNVLCNAYALFVKEFVKIEEEISNTFYSLFVFRNIIDFARQEKLVYATDPRSSTSRFSDNVFNAIKSVADFCTLSDVDFSILLCSLLTFSEQLEFFLSKMLNDKMVKKFEQYDKCNIANIWKILTIFDMTFKDPYTYTQSSKLHFFNIKEGVRTLIEIDQDIATYLNKLPQHSRGMYLHTLLLQQQ